MGVELPAFVGMVQVINVSSSAIFHIGDLFQASPISTTKTYSGAGSFNTGYGLSVYNGQSNTNTFDSDVSDQPVAFTL